MNNNEYIGPESKPVQDDDNKSVKKDTVTKTAIKKEDDKINPIGSPVEEKKKKKGILKRIFGGKDNR
jgi:penicillin-binding protein 1A